ncbi:transmembrane protein 53 [Rhinolophus ferrumequinum]|uniref:Transmembrane protein 53 n=1 Tax=Rhinolophus ferrumequinum TaxID=59479 RepID=A0A7J7X893_RHIFE|nr:transmembrane protein 53 [Rhinolophus ferrumequinum]
MLSAELDYTIEIPDQACGIQENSEGGKEAGTRQPLVILLGWGGCSDKNLAKYSAIYHKRGCIVIRYTAPWHMVFFSESLGIPSLRVLAQKLLELLFDYEIEKEPLLFHVFSNAGVMLYRYVLELLQNHRRFCHLRVVGTIFDSGPGDNAWWRHAWHTRSWCALWTLCPLHMSATSATTLLTTRACVSILCVAVSSARVLAPPTSPLLQK